MLELETGAYQENAYKGILEIKENQPVE